VAPPERPNGSSDDKLARAPVFVHCPVQKAGTRQLWLRSGNGAPTKEAAAAAPTAMTRKLLVDGVRSIAAQKLRFPLPKYPVHGGQHIVQRRCGRGGGALGWRLCHTAAGADKNPAGSGNDQPPLGGSSLSRRKRASHGEKLVQACRVCLSAQFAAAA
jgi:hypothetical protein